MSQKKRRKTGKDSNNRLHFIVAVVFLLVGVILLKLFAVQIVDNDLYTALASDQHNVFNKLMPKRGNIYYNNQEYPLVTNKDFALIFAIPKKVKNPEQQAEKFYEILDQQNVEAEVEKLLEEDDFFKISTTTNYLSAQSELKLQEAFDNRKKEEFRKIKKELEIEARKEKIIKKYFDKLSKKNDPYEPIKRKVSNEQLQKIIEANFEGVSYIMESHRYYPENNIGSHISGFVGFNENGGSGKYGLEGFFNEELSGIEGSVKAERSAAGELIIVSDREYKKQVNGSDFVLTIDHSLQFNICKGLKESIEKHEADGGSIVVVNPETGAVLAMCSFPDYDPNNYNKVEDASVFNNKAIFDAYEPGSIFKVFTLAAGLDQEKITPKTIYDDKGYVMIEGWHKPIKNSDFETKGGHGWVDMNTVLEKSLNTGTVFVINKVGYKVFADYVKDFGFGEKTGIELETEGFSNIVNLNRKTIRPVEAATASFGQGITATPLQLVMAYAAIANRGILMKPYLVDKIITDNGEEQKTQSRQVRRVISERAAMLLSGMMVNVVDGGHAKLAAVPGYYVAGKTGTAQVANKDSRGYSEKTIHSFVGFAPVDEPKFVMIVELDDPKDVEYSASSAAPLFGKMADFILKYYQVPKER